MALIRASGPLCRELTRLLPARPFHVRFWDGGAVDGNDARRRRRSSCGEPSALAALPAGARVAGSWSRLRRWLAGRRRPRRGVHRRRRLGAAVARHARTVFAWGWRSRLLLLPGGHPAASDARADPPRWASQHRARRGGGPLPLRRRQRVLRPVPGRVDDLQLRDLLARRADARGGPARETRTRRGQARARARDASARRGLRLGELRDPRGPRTTALRDRGHHLASAGRARAQQGRRGGSLDRRRDPAWPTTAQLPRSSFDAIASIGMAEHVGESQIDLYARVAVRAAASGRVAAQPRDRRPGPRTRAARGPLLHALRVPRRRAAAALARRSWRSSEPASRPSTSRASGEDYAVTLRHWSRRLDEHLDEAEAIAGPERTRIWRLYLRAARHGFETRHTSVYQVRARRPG